MLRAESLHGNAVTYVRLEGVADGKLPAQLLAEVIREPTVVLDLRGVSQVSDVGLSAWQAMLAAAEAKARRLLAIECSPAVVSRLNADPSFLGRTEVVSVRAALRCEHCARETEATIPVDQPVTADDLWFSCAQCDAVLSPQADPTTYFAFTHKVPVTSLDADMASVVHLANHPENADEELGEPLNEEPDTARAPLDAVPTAAVTPEVEAEPEPPRRAKNKGKKKAAPIPEQESEPTVVASPAPRPPADEATSQTSAAAPVEPTREIPAVSRASAAEPAAASADTLAVPVPDLGRRDVLPAKSPKHPTDPALKPPSQEKTDLDRRSPPNESRLAFLLRRTREQRPALIAALIGWVWAGVLFAILILSGPVGIPPEEILAFHQALKQEELPTAEALLATRKLPPPLTELAETAISRRRQEIRTRLQAEAQAAYEKQAFAEALSQAEKARALAPDERELIYLIADSMRQLGRLPESASHYARFVELAADDPRLDDALFWQGEAALAINKPEEARMLFVRVNAMDTSNFKRSAERRLSELAAMVPAPPPEPPPAPAPPSTP